MRHLILVLLALALPDERLLAQRLDARDVFPRPELARDADPNDWGAYYDLGVEQLRKRRPERAEPAFYWASRLNPERAEPYFARWVAFHLRDQKRWMGYLDGREKELSKPEVIAMDSVRLRAMIRNPFVYRGLELILWDEMPGRFGRDTYTRGWLAYSVPDFPAAARLFGSAIDVDPEGRAWARMLRAQVFVSLQQYDSALAELETLRAVLEARDAARLVLAYESREYLHYAIGILEAVQRRPDRAREAMARALTDNLGFFPAHQFLGDLALAANDGAEALREYEAALAIGADDPLLRYRQGLALVRLGRRGEGAEAFRAAIAQEPNWAAPWLELGRVLERTGDEAGARAAYRGFVARAPAADARGVTFARGRLAALEAPPGTP
ncbi:MAG TPA: tetratricopeptide repeat protein [Gemmatimonadaceae bacterium]